MSEYKRYSDTDLAEFKAIIEAKLESSTSQYENLMSQIKEITENTSGDYTKDISDFSSSQGEVDMLNTMANRQRIYTHDLQAALVRIRNKTYGICIITGEMIDKKRLLAVPTTTKSLIAKAETEAANKQKPTARKSAADFDDDDDEDKPKRKAEPKKPKVLTKVIKKSSDAVGAKKPVDDLRSLLGDDDDDDDLDNIDVDNDLMPDIDLGDDEDSDDMDD